MKIKISSITVSEDRMRTVEKNDKYYKLKASIERFGIIQSIGVQDGPRNTYILIFGERRLTACKELGMEKISCRILIPNRPLDAMLIEYEENQHRENFTWQEEAVALRRMYDAVLEENPGYTHKEFSSLTNVGESRLSALFRLLDFSDQYPQIWIMIHWSKADLELTRMIKGSLLEEKLKRSQAKKSLDAAMVGISIKPKGHHENCPCSKCRNHRDSIRKQVKPTGDILIYPEAMELLASLDDKSVDLCVTDPPFGIDIEDSRSMEARHHIYDNDDDKVSIMNLMERVIIGLKGKMKPGAHVYMFFAIQYYNDLTQVLLREGFTINKVPLLWVKNGGGSTAQPSYFPGNVYEPVLMAFAPGKRRKLEVLGLNNVIRCDSVHPSKKNHPLEKSINLYNEIIRRSACKGDLFIDPFSGVGNSLVAAKRLGCNVRGAEKVERYRSIGELKLMGG